jgi:hypothetical protein
MIRWQFFPKSNRLPTHLASVINIFQEKTEFIDSSRNNLKSNDVLSTIALDLENLGYMVEKSKKSQDKIFVPVLFGLNGKLEKYFEADAYNEKENTVIEVEAGRGVLNNQFLKDLFQACMMNDVCYLVTAVRNIYLKNDDFKTVIAFYEALYASGRLNLPLKGLLVIGY